MTRKLDTFEHCAEDCVFGGEACCCGVNCQCMTCLHLSGRRAQVQRELTERIRNRGPACSGKSPCDVCMPSSTIRVWSTCPWLIGVKKAMDSIEAVPNEYGDEGHCKHGCIHCDGDVCSCGANCCCDACLDMTFRHEPCCDNKECPTYNV